MLHMWLLLHIVCFIPTMRAAGSFDGFFKALVVCLLWLMVQPVCSSQLSAPGAVTGTYGGSVTVSCQYDLRFKANAKYWCRGPVYELCAVVIKTSWGRLNDRSSIVDDKESGVFTVTMTSLQESDKDMYWCVIARHGRNVFAGVRLHLSHSATSITTTQINSLLTVEQEETGWWAILRWILFISMLCCLALTPMLERRIKAARGMPSRPLRTFRP